MRGRSSKRRPGAFSRRGPSQDRGARPRSPVRIGQQVDPIELNEQRGVTDPRHRGLCVVLVQCPTIICLTREAQIARGNETGPYPAGEVLGADPPARTRKGWIRVTEATLHMMSRSPRQRLLGKPGARGSKKRQNEPKQPQPTLPVTVHLRSPLATLSDPARQPSFMHMKRRGGSDASWTLAAPRKGCKSVAGPKGVDHLQASLRGSRFRSATLLPTRPTAGAVAPCSPGRSGRKAW